MTKLLGHFPIPVASFRQQPDECSSCKAASSEQFKALLNRRRLNLTEAQVKAHFKANPPSKGDTLILVMGQFNQNAYRLVRIANPASGKQSRIITDHGCAFGGASYYQTGKSTFAPKGQTVLRPYVAAVAARLTYESNTVLSDDDLLALLAD